LFNSLWRSWAYNKYGQTVGWQTDGGRG